jgi:hypothetical protein
MRASLKTLLDLLHYFLERGQRLVTREDLLDKYRELSKSRRKKTVHFAYPTPIEIKRSLDAAFNDHLYTATSLSFLKTISRGKLYEISDSFATIDSKIRSNDPKVRTEGLRQLAGLLAKRFPPFDDFLALLKERQMTRRELSEARDQSSERMFNPQTLNTLIEWGNFTAAVDVLRPSGKRFVKKSDSSKYSNEDFWSALRDAHNKYSRTEMIGVSAYYSSIPKLRDLVGQKLIISLEEFDVYLQRLLEDPRYRPKIALAVGHPGYLATEKGKPGGLLRGLGRGFKYNKHNYYFLRIK